MRPEERKTRVVRSLRNGQVTIPAAFRRELGIRDDSLLEVTLNRGELRIRPIQAAEAVQGSPWLKEAYDAFADVRKHLERHSSGEIDAAIDEAVKAVRSQHA